jgi:hypothetical protein
MTHCTGNKSLKNAQRLLDFLPMKNIWNAYEQKSALEQSGALPVMQE